jgi:hypothetical protein
VSTCRNTYPARGKRYHHNTYDQDATFTMAFGLSKLIITPNAFLLGSVVIVGGSADQERWKMSVYLVSKQ